MRRLFQAICPSLAVATLPGPSYPTSIGTAGPHSPVIGAGMPQAPLNVRYAYPEHSDGRLSRPAVLIDLG